MPLSFAPYTCAPASMVSTLASACGVSAAALAQVAVATSGRADVAQTSNSGTSADPGRAARNGRSRICLMTGARRVRPAIGMEPGHGRDARGDVAWRAVHQRRRRERGRVRVWCRSCMGAARVPSRARGTSVTRCCARCCATSARASWCGRRSTASAATSVIGRSSREMRSCSTSPRSRSAPLAARYAGRLLTATPPIAIGGGADVIRQDLEAGVVDELAIIVAPVILGGGKALARRCPTRGSQPSRRGSPPAGPRRG